MPLNWNDEEIPSKADKTTDILGLKEIGGVGQLISPPSYFAALYVKMGIGLPSLNLLRLSSPYSAFVLIKIINRHK
ncbi:MAG: hypothetical protein IKP88_14825 [Lachnospiraceae bacterium]|nr:hypothetical protein [Lachnospiraceae bacterium]